MPVPGVALYMYSIVHDGTRTSSVGPVVRRVSSAAVECVALSDRWGGGREAARYVKHRRNSNGGKEHGHAPDATISSQTCSHERKRSRAARARSTCSRLGQHPLCNLLPSPPPRCSPECRRSAQCPAP